MSFIINRGLTDLELSKIAAPYHAIVPKSGVPREAPRHLSECGIWAFRKNGLDNAAHLNLEIA